MSRYSEADPSLTFYTDTDYTGDPLSVAHGETGLLATDNTIWNYQSVTASDMHAFCWSTVDTSDTSINYQNHIESVISADIPDLTALYSDVQFPLQYLSIDPAQAFPVWLDMSDVSSGTNAVASSALVGGGSVVTITTLSRPDAEGVLGFIGQASGSSVVATCSYGHYDDTTGEVGWTGLNTGIVVLEYINDAVSLLSVTGFPESWTFAAPKMQADGSWVIAASGGTVAGLTVYEDVDYAGNTATVAEETSILLCDAEYGWQWSSVQVGEERMFGHTLIADLTSQDFRRYADSLEVMDNPNLTMAYATSASVQGTTLGADDILVRLALQPADLSLAVVAVTQQSASGLEDEYLASVMSTALTLDGVLLVMNKSQGQATVPMQVGYMDDTTGLVDWGFTTSLVATWDDDLQLPEILLGNDAPEGWVLSSPQATGKSGEYSTTLSGIQTPGIMVRGARGSNNSYGPSSSTALVSLNTVTFKPVDALWQYEGESDATTTARFIDIYPEKILNISTLDNDRFASLRPINIAGDFYAAGVAGAFAALENTGNVVVWGNSGTDGTLPSDIAAHTDLRTLVGNCDSFAALTTSGTVLAWGNSDDGGSVPSDIATRTDLVSLTGSSYAFAALTTSGSAVAWGGSAYGGSIPSDIAARTDLVSLIGGSYSFAALTTSSSVVAWGDGSAIPVPSDVAARTDLVSLIGGTFAYAALTDSGSVIAWGHSDYGGSVPSEIAARTDLVSLAQASCAFAALSASGSVVAWGNSDYGSNVPADIAARTDLVSVVGNQCAFAALTTAGSVVAWGNSAYGSDVPADVAAHTDLVNLISNNSAFAALTATGGVVAWGSPYNPDNGGVIPTDTIPLLTDVVAIYSNEQSFIALKSDNTVVVWGAYDSGNMDNIPASLQGNISYLES